MTSLTITRIMNITNIFLNCCSISNASILSLFFQHYNLCSLKYLFSALKMKFFQIIKTMYNEKEIFFSQLSSPFPTFPCLTLSYFRQSNGNVKSHFCSLRRHLISIGKKYHLSLKKGRSMKSFHLCFVCHW